MKRLMILLIIPALLLALVPSSAAQDDTWITHQGELTYIQTPAEWVNLTDAQQLSLLQKKVEEDRPQQLPLADFLESSSTLIKDNSLDLLVINPLTLAHIAVSVTDLEEERDLQELAAQIFDSYAETDGELIDTDIVNLPVGEAYFAEIKLTGVVPNDKDRVFERFQYVLVDGTQLISVSFTVDELEAEDFTSIYEEMIQSFGIGEAPIDAVGVGLGGAPVVEQGVQHTNLGVTLTTPENWLDVTDAAAIEAYFAAGNPADDIALPYMENMAQTVESNTFAMVLVEPVHIGYVYFMVTDFADVPVTTLENQTISTLESDDEIQLKSSELIEIAVGEALRIDLVRPLQGDVPYHEIRLMLVKNAKLYFFFLGVPDEVYTDFEPLFDTIINTITIEN